MNTLVNSLSTLKSKQKTINILISNFFKKLKENKNEYFISGAMADGVFTFRILNGEILPDKNTEEYFLYLLSYCLDSKTSPCSIIVRENTNFKFESKKSDGESEWLICYNMYGALITNGIIKPIEKDRMKIICNTDLISGKIKKKPINDFYKKFNFV